MLNQPIVTSPDPGMPANLRYIENGDALNTANHQAQAADVAQALGHLKARSTSLASQAAPDGTTLVGFSGFLTFAASTLRVLLEGLIALTSYDAVAGGDADTTFSTPYKTVNAAIANVNRTYSVDLSTNGQWIEFHRRDVGTGDLIIDRLGGAASIITLSGTATSGCRIQVRGGVPMLQWAYGTFTIGTEA